jgi:hypothetical protein
MKNVSELRSVLSDILNKVKTGKIDTKSAQTIVGLSNSMIKSAALELEHLKFTKEKKQITFLKTQE